MSRIVVTLKDGRRMEFADRRPGGSYTNTLRAEGEFLVVTDVWDKETWLPVADVSTAEKHDR